MKPKLEPIPESNAGMPKMSNSGLPNFAPADQSLVVPPRDGDQEMPRATPKRNRNLDDSMNTSFAIKRLNTSNTVQRESAIKMRNAKLETQDKMNEVSIFKL